MYTVKEFRSTNGRWGAEVFASQKVDGNPIRGTVEDKGSIGGFQSLVVYPDDEAETWVLLEGNAHPVEGAVMVWGCSLQSGQYGSVLLLGPVAIVKVVGYKGRSERHTLYKNGVPQDLSQAHLLALGFLSAEPVEQPDDPPAVTGTMAAALHRAGLV